MSLPISTGGFTTNAVGIAVAAAAAAVMITYGCFRLKPRRATSAAPPKATQLRPRKAPAKQKAEAKQKAVPAGSAAGVSCRQCYFCEVLVSAEQTDAHLSGKKHKLLAGSTLPADCWCWVHAAATAPGGPSAPQQTVAPASAVPAAAKGGDGTSSARSSGWHPVASGKRSRKPQATAAGAAAEAGAAAAAAAAWREDYRALPTLGFKVVGGIEPILPLIRSGHKSIELR